MIADQKAGEKAKQRSMARMGKRFMGRKAILRKSIYSRPKKRMKLFQRFPYIACKDKELRKKMLKWREERNARYREALESLRAGVKDVVFPIGTWYLHFFCGQKREPHGGCLWQALMAET